MTRMMKDSGVEWIGEIPTDWERTSLLNNLRTFITDGPHETPKLVDSGIPFISVDSLNDSEDIDLSVVKKFISEEDYNLYQKKTHLEKGDILFSKSATIGKTAILKNEKCMVWSPLAVIKPNNERCLTKYLYYILSCENAIKYASLQGSYNTQVNLGMRTLEKIYIPVPPLSEQQKIAAFLDEKCGAINEIISKTEQSIEEYKKLKQSVITKAVTKGIRPNRPMQDSNIEWIGEIPTDWDLINIKYLKSKAKNSFVDGPFGSNLKSEHYVENGDVYVIESGFISTGKFIYKAFKTITKEHFDTIKRSECKAQDVIIAKIGANYGIAAELPKLDKPSVVSGNSLKITLDQSKILNFLFVKLLEVVKKNGGYEGTVNETAQPALSLTYLNNLKLPVPPLEEQKEIVAYLDEKCAEIDTLVEKKQQFLAEMANYKKSLIYEYVTGKKEVE